MRGLIDGLMTKNSLTANGAVTNESSLNDCLDFFFLAGASRTMSESDIIAMFSKAFAENKNTALKVLFWARDVREGAGERRIFRTILLSIAEKDKEMFNSLLAYVDEYGRWDDLFYSEAILAHTLSYITNVIKISRVTGNDFGLLFKWLPREKSKNKKIATKIRKALSLSAKEYRKLIVDNSSTVEQVISQKKWGQVDYKAVPSKAFNLYRNAFARHDEDRFNSFLEKVEDGETTINAGAIFPVDIYRSSENGGNRKSIVAQWNSLPDYLNDENILPVCDVSGSMGGGCGNTEVCPMDVSVSLGVYLSERSKGVFKDAFITFSDRPQLQYLKGDCVDRFNQLRRADWGMSTNLEATFDLILNTATRDGLTQDELPSKILIISDMEFNYCGGSRTNFDSIKAKFSQHGYTMPGIVFWNVNGRTGNVPVQATEANTALVSGYSPSIVKAVLGGEDLTPIGVMIKAISGERYEFIERIVEV